MKILIDKELKEWIKTGIYPHDLAYINPASVDLCLGHGWIDIEGYTLSNNDLTLYPRSAYTDVWNTFARIFHFQRHPTAVLATTLERVVLLPDEAASIKLKTTPSREGLGHPIADWVDPGFQGQLTLMLHAHKRISIPYGRRIVQIVVYKLDYPVEISYAHTGHYQDQAGPTISWRHMWYARHKRS
jgi:deoxycytidine triphosphate deaminase